eukprot:gene12909-biopygen2654
MIRGSLVNPVKVRNRPGPLSEDCSNSWRGPMIKNDVRAFSKKVREGSEEFMRESGRPSAGEGQESSCEASQGPGEVRYRTDAGFPNDESRRLLAVRSPYDSPCLAYAAAPPPSPADPDPNPIAAAHHRLCMHRYVRRPAAPHTVPRLPALGRRAAAAGAPRRRPRSRGDRRPTAPSTRPSVCAPFVPHGWATPPPR